MSPLDIEIATAASCPKTAIATPLISPEVKAFIAIDLCVATVVFPCGVGAGPLIISLALAIFPVLKALAIAIVLSADGEILLLEFISLAAADTSPAESADATEL